MLILNDFQLHENAGEIQDTYGGAGQGLTKKQRRNQYIIRLQIIGEISNNVLL